MDKMLFDLEAEVIQTMAAVEKVALKGFSLLKAEDFSHQPFADVFRAMQKSFSENKPMEEYYTFLTANKEAKEAMKTARSYSIGAGNAEHYMQLIAEQAQGRRILNGVNELSLSTSPVWIETEELKSGIRSLLTIADEKTTDDEGDILKAQHEVINEIIEKQKGNGKQSITTGYSDIDKILGGLDRAEYYILAGHTSMGKTAMMLSMADRQAKKGIRVLIFSLEMRRTGLVQRLQSMNTGIAFNKIRQGTIAIDDLPKLSLPYKTMRILDKPADTFQIRSKIQTIKPDIVYVDYIGKVKPQRAESRRVEIDKISQELANIAKDFNIPVVALSQLSRATDKAADNRPRLSHLKESSGLEQDASAVLFIHRDGYYNKLKPQSDAEIIIAKNRQGMTGEVRILWDGECVRYRSLDVLHDEYLNGYKEIKNEEGMPFHEQTKTIRTGKEKAARA